MALVALIRTYVTRMVVLSSPVKTTLSLFAMDARCGPSRRILDVLSKVYSYVHRFSFFAEKQRT